MPSSPRALYHARDSTMIRRTAAWPARLNSTAFVSPACSSAALARSASRALEKSIGMTVYHSPLKSIATRHACTPPTQILSSTITQLDTTNPPNPLPFPFGLQKGAIGFHLITPIGIIAMRFFREFIESGRHRQFLAKSIDQCQVNASASVVA